MSRRASGSAAVLLMLCARAALAQSSQYPAPGDGLGTSNGHTRIPVFYSARIGPWTLTARDLDGPPAPEAMRALVSLDPGQLSAYAQAYADLMRNTRPRRDSARAAVQTQRQAEAAHDPAGMEERAAVFRRLGDDIGKRDEAFDKSLNTILTEEQRQRYQRWNATVRKAAATSR